MKLTKCNKNSKVNKVENGNVLIKVEKVKRKWYNKLDGTYHFYIKSF